MTDEWAAYRSKIDEQLDTKRPQRSGSGDKDWREPIYGWARNHIPNESNLIRHFAEQEVDRREALATKRGNKLLRRWAKGQTPLFWSDLGPLPVVVNGVRIRMDALGADDMDSAALELEDRAKQVHDEVLILTKGMHDIADEARRRGVSYVSQIGDLQPRELHGPMPLDGYGEDDDDPERTAVMEEDAAEARSIATEYAAHNDDEHCEECDCCDASCGHYEACSVISCPCYGED